MASPARPVFVTKKELSFELPTSGDHAALVAGLDQRFRMFKLVVARLPKKFTPYKHEPSYRLTYYIETLSCGHSQPYFPQAGPMSRRRHCAACAAALTESPDGGRLVATGPELGAGVDHPAPVLPPKKPVTSSQDEQERAA